MEHEDAAAHRCRPQVPPGQSTTPRLPSACCAMLCVAAVPCSAMLLPCHPMLSAHMLCYGILCNAVLCYTVARNAVLCYAYAADDSQVGIIVALPTCCHCSY